MTATPAERDMSAWVDDLTIPLPPGRTVGEVVDFVLSSALRGAPARAMNRQVAAEFGLSPEHAELARDRSFGGLVRAATALDCPPRDTDPVAWECFQRCATDPSLVTRIYPHRPPKDSAVRGPGDATSRIRPGEIYEDCAFHPVLCTAVAGDEVRGISLVDGSIPRVCSMTTCGVMQLSVGEAAAVRSDWPAHAQRRQARIDPDSRS